MRTMLLAAAGSALLAWAPTAWAQVDTGAQAYRMMNGPADSSYGSSGGAGIAAGGRDGGTESGGWLEGLQIISPNDPVYSYSDPPHRGQPMEWEYNGDDGGRGTSYPQIVGHDDGGG